MIKEGMEWIRRNAADPTKEILHGDEVFNYSRENLYLVVPPVCEEIRVRTLLGLVEYANSAVKVPFDQLIFHIMGPHVVRLIGRLHPKFRSREVFCVAGYENPDAFNFGQWLDQEAFLLALATGFRDNEAKSAVMQTVGNMNDDLLRNYSDDGFTQSITVRKGLRSAEKKIKNPFCLAPNRIWPELRSQPIVNCTLRFTKNSSEQILVGLWEEAGDQWILEAIYLIKEYLLEQTDNGATIIG